MKLIAEVVPGTEVASYNWAIEKCQYCQFGSSCILPRYPVFQEDANLSAKRTRSNKKTRSDSTPQVFKYRVKGFH